MWQLRRSSTLSFGIPCTATLWLILLAAFAPAPASAQTGVIAFRGHCTDFLYAMRSDGSERVALPLPPLPEPTGRYRYWDP
jgi:hypothetical protein